MFKKVLLATLVLFSIQMNAENVFLSDFKTTNGAIPFDRISVADYEPAIMQGIKEHEAEIDAIAANPAPATFENTIVKMEQSGKTLTRVLGVFYAMLSAECNDDLMAVSMRISPVLDEHGSSITLNEKLWQRIKVVYDNFDKTKHDGEDWMLLKKTYDSFVRSGASLKGADRDKYKELSKKLTELTLTLMQNCLKDKPRYEMWLTKDDLAGLPESTIEAAAGDAKAKGREGEYLFTMNQPSYSPFMKYSSRRDLREKLYKMYNKQCTEGEFSNMQVCKDIVNTRMAIANLLGYKCFAAYNLEQKMAGDTKHVYDMLNQLRAAYAPVQKADMKRLEEFASKLEGKKVTIMPWDYSYYADKEKDAKYNVNDELLRPYFELNSVVKGIFDLASKLYGIHFTENYNAQVYHPDVKAYDVTDNDGNFVGMLYTDFFPRETKRAGAWMTNFREEYIDENGKEVRPLVTLVMNFTKPTETKPSLLTFYEVETFAHEFGHGLHGLLAKGKYSSITGTNVRHDFVELFSQFNENFLTEREVLDGFARHYQTGEKIPQELVDKVIASSQYGAAYACMRQLSFGFLDMGWYTLTKPFDGDLIAFEQEAMKPVKVFDAVEGCAMSPQFGHIFSGGYAAGYYGYKWAEVLDADAFSKFKEDGIFNPDTAKAFKKMLQAGGTVEPMELYKEFRGREPKIEALMRRDGIIK
mgnify:FL=1